MDNGFVGILSHIPQGYRCYILFLPNETSLVGAAEEYIMRHFWEVASSVGEDVLFTGVVHGDGLVAARKRFNITTPTESAIVLLDMRPMDWDGDFDPIVIIPLATLKTEYDVLELLHLLVNVSKERNFIGKVKRKQTFEKVREYLGYLPTVGSLVKYVFPKG
jgi:hypothetical protein